MDKDEIEERNKTIYQLSLFNETDCKMNGFVWFQMGVSTLDGLG